MEKIKWMDKVMNEEVLMNMVKEETKLMREARKRKGNWLGHVVRGKAVLKIALKCSIEREINEEEDF